MITVTEIEDSIAPNRLPSPTREQLIEVQLSIAIEIDVVRDVDGRAHAALAATEREADDNLIPWTHSGNLRASFRRQVSPAISSVPR